MTTPTQDLPWWLLHDRTGLTCAIGIGDTKAGQNGDQVRQGGAGPHLRLDSSNWIPMMGDRDVVELWGIGNRTAPDSGRTTCAR